MKNAKNISNIAANTLEIIATRGAITNTAGMEGGNMLHISEINEPIEKVLAIPGTHIELMEGVYLWNRENENFGGIHLFVENPWGNSNFWVEVTPKQAAEIATWDYQRIWRFALDYHWN
jgi:hypothetical protein